MVNHKTSSYPRPHSTSRPTSSHSFGSPSVRMTVTLQHLPDDLLTQIVESMSVGGMKAFCLVNRLMRELTVSRQATLLPIW